MLYKKSDEKIINFKSDIFCNEWDAFKKDNLTYCTENEHPKIGTINLLIQKLIT